MDKKDLQNLLEQVARGSVKPEEALLQIKVEPYKDLGFAKVDTHRGIRQGMAKNGSDYQNEPGGGRLCRKRNGSSL